MDTRFVQTPSVYHCLQNFSGYDGDKFIRQSKFRMTQSKLMILGSDYVTGPELTKSKHQISFVGVLNVKKTVIVSCKVVQRMYTANNSALCLGFTHSWHVSWHRRFKLELILLGQCPVINSNPLDSDTDPCSPMYIIATSQVSSQWLQGMLTWP